MVQKEAMEDNQNKGKELANTKDYGPWMLVNYGKKKFSKNWNDRPASQSIVEQSNSDGTADKLKGGGTLEKDSNLVVNNSFNALVDMEDGELLEPPPDVNLGEVKAVRVVNEVIKNKDNNKVMEGIDSVFTETTYAGINGKEKSVQSTKNKRPKQLRELGPINSSMRSHSLELEGKGNLGSNPHNPF
ncbi:hypothetical protein MA16_Dca020720 [Dendrobium catenatum]|uniref:Uncharacterized protein n=1 Tax=Dendrobium catenatum TaxID=906689 RepID=A0A2I0WIU7_9ASPA|nr:hypothetical protein MA16_Dca020720 [Dendrobium catenatum]